MSDEWDDFLANLRRKIEARVRDQVGRHLRVSPHIDRKQVIDIQISQEREKMERIAGRLDDEDKSRPAELVRALIKEWLPELARDLKGL